MQAAALFLQSDGKVIISEDTPTETYYTTRLNSNGSLDSSYPRVAGLTVGLDASDRVFVDPGADLERLDIDGTVDPSFQPPPPVPMMVYLTNSSD
jgi:hypothetical protein